MNNRTPANTTGKVQKPEKTWPDFHIYCHPRGYWMCKRGGVEWRYEADAHKSYQRYIKDEGARLEGTQAVAIRRRYLLKDAVNLYLTRQKRKHDDGELSAVQFAKCRLELQTKLPKALPLGTALNAFRAIEAGDDGPAALFAR